MRNASKLVGLSIIVLIGGSANAADAMKDALIFHASFDGKVDADHAAGDKRLHTDIERKEVKVGLHRDDMSIAAGAGRYGDALRFTQKTRSQIFYQAEGNMAFRPRDWSGTISVWLSLDPDQDLEPGYCDPVQVTDKGPLDEGIFIEFTKDHEPRRFRMAMCPAAGEWNPDKRKWEEIPLTERPLVEIENPPFGRGKWTHIVITWENFNTRRPDGVSKLYINGELRGAVTGWLQNYYWTAANARIRLGLSYIGLMDELTIFNRALTAEEVKTLHALPNGATSLHR